MSQLTVIKFYCDDEIRRVPMNRSLGELTYKIFNKFNKYEIIFRKNFNNSYLKKKKKKKKKIAMMNFVSLFKEFGNQN